MRAENLPRLTSTDIKLKDPIYLTNKFLFSELDKAIQKYASGNLLDIGCGNKPYKIFFENKIESYTGCDIIQSDRNEVDIICPATDIPLPDNCKDTVFTTQVIEHVADHQKLLSEAYRILKPGGYIILSGPMYWEHHEQPFDFFRFTSFGFDYIFTKCGFKEIQIIPCGGKWALTGQVILNSFRSSFNNKSFSRRLFKVVYTLLGIKYIINIGCSYLDKIDKDYSATLNFVVIARKDF